MQRILLIIFIPLAVAAIVYSTSREAHQFLENECSLCHTTVNPGPNDITSEITIACEMCHPDYPKTQSHPTDIYPDISIPDDMPLTDGRLTCLTCHFGHLEKVQQTNKDHFFLRRPIRGIIFCSACHKINEKRHIVFDNIHRGEYKETDRSTRIDRMSLECIECHDAYLPETIGSLGAGRWKHWKKDMPHPIGIQYKEASNKKMNKFRPQSTLDEKLKLYDGKIGCGTCHSIYSREKSMLSMNNSGSTMCLQCHIK